MNRTPALAPRISFVVPVRNDVQRLRRCLGSIARASRGSDVEVIVVDNASQDGSGLVAESMGARVLHIADMPVSGLRNKGVAVARGELLAFVDADHEIGESWVSAALARFADPRITAIGAPYHAPSQGTWVQRTYDRFRTHARTAADTDWIGSGNLVVRRDAFSAVGGFDARLHACEDVDFCARLRQAGYRLVEDPALYSEHLGDPETLRLLFKSELWRGRNNLSVTLTSERTLRSLVSLAIPIVNLAALAGIVVGGVGGSWRIVALSTACVSALALLRAAPMLKRGRLSAWSAVQCTVVAAVYHVARALALVWPAKHRRAHVPASVAVRSVR